MSSIESFTYGGKTHKVPELLDFMDRETVKLGLLDIILIAMNGSDEQSAQEVINRAAKLMHDLDIHLER
ncbi:hypothetical protein [Sporolactobacillus putidus]|uniref:Uncharacterized protein n=1 Tax=Sporolactobacillus putidus TaxID=492735 RepID=A0A917S6G3_9BACL|nr:hypothetical protein [Sporolactobacillus putidus]GGL58092.1 hypothetical protein GCM10007968_22660 [Sporolactobacillus putidus]